MDISIILPTRDRINAVTELIQTIYDTSDDFSKVEICLYIDPDDNNSKEGLLKLIEIYGQNVKFTTCNEKINLSQMWNYAYDNISTGEIIMLCGDDIRFRTKSWDTIIKNEFSKIDDKIMLIFGNDLLQCDRLATHAFVHRRWIQVSGFWLPPYFCAWYVDTWLDDVSKMINRRLYLPNIITEHMHYTIGKSAYDETTKRCMENANRENPSVIWNKTGWERVAHANLLLEYIEKNKCQYIPKKILVTGGLGMIGSNLIKELINTEKYDKNNIYVVDNLWRGCIDNIMHNNVPVINVDTNVFYNDLSNPAQIDHIITSNNIDTVIHLADVVAGVGYVTQNELFVFNQNILINSNTIRSIYNCRNHVKAFINIGTACCFPKKLQSSLEAKLCEDQLYPAEPETGYGWSKLMGMYETELLQKETDILCCNLMFHNVYGTPCDMGERSQVIPSLIKKAITYKSENDFIVWGSGNQGRAFVHVNDVVSSVIMAMKNGYNCGVIQIGPSNCNSIKEIAEIIVEKSGKAINIQYDTSKPEGDFGRCADFSKANKILGWYPKIDIKQGISQMYETIEKHM